MRPTGTTFAESALRKDRLWVLACLAIICLLSWYYLLTGAGTGMSTLAMTTWEFPPPARGSGTGGHWSVQYTAVMLVMWWVMMVAMMIPSATPVILLYARVYRHNHDAGGPAPTLAFLAGYLLAWLAFSVVATALQWGLERLGLVHGMLMWSTSHTLSAVLLIGAGLYQLSSVKQACLARAPMCLRVNLRKLSREDYRDRLGKAGIASEPGWQPESVILESPVPVRELPGHGEGLVSVQDSGAMFAAEVLALAETTSEEPLRLLDACAAPGGKLFHLAERYPSAVLTGLEPSEPRLAHLKAEAARLGHADVRLMAGDATGTDWNPGETFHGILVDAPCSGSGTLRRHPDIKVLRSEKDLVGYRTLQARLLSNLFPLLEPGGVLVYCTCSLFPDENDDVVGAFLKEHPEASVEPLTLPTGMQTRFGWQLLPLPAGPGPDMSVDGFYFARLRSNLPTDARAQGDKAG